MSENIDEIIKNKGNDGAGKTGPQRPFEEAVETKGGGGHQNKGEESG